MSLTRNAHQARSTTFITPGHRPNTTQYISMSIIFVYIHIHACTRVYKHEYIHRRVPARTAACTAPVRRTACDTGRTPVTQCAHIPIFKEITCRQDSPAAAEPSSHVHATCKLIRRKTKGATAPGVAYTTTCTDFLPVSAGKCGSFVHVGAYALELLLVLLDSRRPRERLRCLHCLHLYIIIHTYIHG